MVRGMCDSIVHRGPDDEGYHVDGGCGIGMRRLSIIALGTGHQPIANEDGSVWVVFNGEIYNYVEVRDWLIGRGHRFRTESDTEVLVHLYEEEGARGITRLRGMFAYCIWDARRRKLLLARDPLGKKPLYYAALPGGFYFGSELKCLRVAGVPLDVDQEALKLYFQFGYVPDPWSIYSAVRKLPPGAWLEYSHESGVRLERYWKMPAPREEPGAQTEAQAQERLRQIFDESVRLRMIADVPLGAFLSGGIDSSSVVASMARQSTERVKTFSIGFEEAEFNELGYAALVAKQYNTEHHEILVKPDSVDLTTRLIRQFDEPFADSSAIPTYIVSEFAARHVKVALSGDGGDELFGGYDIFPLIPRLESYDRIPGVTYCDPQVASVGLTEKKAKERGFKVKIGKFPFMAVGKASVDDEREGFVKIVGDSKYDEILGVHIVHAHAGEMISEGVAILNGEMTAEDLVHAIHPHPTLSEGIMEAAHAYYGHTINL